MVVPGEVSTHWAGFKPSPAPILKAQRRKSDGVCPWLEQDKGARKSKNVLMLYVY